MSTYISFIGVIKTPEESVLTTLNKIFPQQTFEEYTGYFYDDGEPVVNYKGAGFRAFKGVALEYKKINEKVHLCKLGGNIGHLVVECKEGNWVEETFCLLDRNQMPIKASDFNPNPIKQLL